IAGVRAGGEARGRHLAVSVHEALPVALASAITASGASVVVESDEAWLARAGAGGIAESRVRLIGGGHTALAEALEGSPDVAIYSDTVTEAGRVELLPFLREQAIAITAHRFGNPDPWSQAALPL